MQDELTGVIGIGADASIFAFSQDDECFANGIVRGRLDNGTLHLNCFVRASRVLRDLRKTAEQER